MGEYIGSSFESNYEWMKKKSDAFESNENSMQFFSKLKWIIQNMQDYYLWSSQITQNNNA